MPFEAPCALQHLLEVPGDRLALAVGVGGQASAARRPSSPGRSRRCALLVRHRPRRSCAKSSSGRTEPSLLGQVADMAVAGQDPVAGAQILVDGLGFGRRFDDDDIHGPALCWPARRAERPLGAPELPGGPPRSTEPQRTRDCRDAARAAPPAPARAAQPATVGDAASHWRTSSSTATGVGPSRSSTCSTRRRRRAPARGGRPPLPARRAGVRPDRGARTAGTRLAQQRRQPASTSAALSTSVAPSRSSWLVPRWRGSSGLPGTAITSRPCSTARRAVISEPERGAASTTTTPSASPEMIRLRRGKSGAPAAAPSGRSLTTAPLAAIPRPRRVLGGIGHVDPRRDHRDRRAVGGQRPPCAAVSMPRARPETTTSPALASSPARPGRAGSRCRWRCGRRPSPPPAGRAHRHAAHGEHGRRVGEWRSAGEGRLAGGQHPPAQRASASSSPSPPRGRPRAPLRCRRAGVRGRRRVPLGRPVALDEAGEGDRAHPFGAGEPHPGQPLAARDPAATVEGGAHGRRG